jgi:2,3-bisphosphoglycerate-dependent phosphoglycerate mutase
MENDDPRHPRFDPRYRDLKPSEIPCTESLKETVERIVPYWKEDISKKVMEQGEVLVAAHGNSLRGIVKYLKNISNEDIVGLNLPTGIPYIFEFDDQMNLLKDYFLGDPEVIRKLMEEVANQAKKK